MLSGLSPVVAASVGLGLVGTLVMSCSKSVCVAAT